MAEPRTGVLLIQLGTPSSPGVRDVRRYLREFLSDPRVIDLPAPLRWALLELVILPTRARVSARAYAQIWTPQGSPLRVHGEALRAGVTEALGEDYLVELGMRYGEPSIRAALERLVAAGVGRIVALPLFPQYSSAATGSARARLLAERDRLRSAPPLETRGAFYADPRFVEAFAASARPHLDEFRPDFALFSFHGLPERQVRKADPTGRHCLANPHCCDEVGPANRDCYRAQCFATARALRAALGLEDRRSAVAFQSRLGRARWIQPYTDRVLPELAERGVSRLAVLCPAFVADCLETLEEIGIRGREQWKALGGDGFLLVPSLNAEPTWIEAVASLVREGDDAGRTPSAPGQPPSSSERAARTPEASESAALTPSR